MDTVFLFESYYIVIFHIPLLFLLALTNTLIFSKTRKSPLLLNYLLLQSLLGLWMISKLLKTFSPNVSLKFFFVIMQYCAVCFLGPLFIRFAYLFSKQTLPPRKAMAFLYSLSLLMLFLIITNPLHFLFYSRFDFWGDSFGPLFYLQQGVHFTLLFTGVLLCVKAFLASFGQKKSQALISAVAILIPIAANILYVFKGFKAIFGFTPPFDITPVSASISLVLFSFATFKLDYFDSLNLALTEALADLPEGVFISYENRIIYTNRTFQEMSFKNPLLNKELFSFSGSSVKGRVQFNFEPNHKKDLIFKNDLGEYIRVIVGLVEEPGSFIRCVNITEVQEALEQLNSKNKELLTINAQLSNQIEVQRKLTAMKTRNFIAAEAHDILGHSVMLALSMLEMARLSDDLNRIDLLKRSAEVLKKGLPKLKEASEEKRQAIKSFETMVNELIEEMADTSVTIKLKSSELNFSEDLTKCLYKICRESITNALRHGGGDKIDILLMEREKSIKLYIIDNGAGCQNLVKGMGIKSMEERARDMGGSVSFRSLEDQGFCVEADFPKSNQIVLQSKNDNLSSIF